MLQCAIDFLSCISVSLDFKRLPLNVANSIENKPLDTSYEKEDDPDDCKILLKEKCKSKKIER